MEQNNLLIAVGGVEFHEIQLLGFALDMSLTACDAGVLSCDGCRRGASEIAGADALGVYAMVEASDPSGAFAEALGCALGCQHDCHAAIGFRGAV